jgi:hypothetical protein
MVVVSRQVHGHTPCLSADGRRSAIATPGKSGNGELPAPKQVRRQVDPKAKNRYAARRRIKKARLGAAKARHAQAWAMALPLPRVMQEKAVKRTAAWEAKIASRLQEQKKTLGECVPRSRSTLVDEEWLARQEQAETQKQNEHWRRRPEGSRCDKEVVLPLPKKQMATKTVQKAEGEVNGGDEAEARKGAMKAKEAGYQQEAKLRQAAWGKTAARSDETRDTGHEGVLEARK